MHLLILKSVCWRGRGLWRLSPGWRCWQVPFLHSPSTLTVPDSTPHPRALLQPHKSQLVNSGPTFSHCLLKTAGMCGSHRRHIRSDRLNRYLQKTPPRNSRIHGLPKYTWNILQDGSYVRAQDKSQ